MESRVSANTARLLDLFDQHGVRSTFFVLGWVAERHPAIVKAIVERGHEVASHGYAHRLVYDQTPSAFREDVRRAIDAGLGIEAFAPKLSFFFACHNDLFEEVAKFRAARRLWARLMRERFHASDAACRLRFHTQTGGVTLTAQQPLNNESLLTMVESFDRDNNALRPSTFTYSSASQALASAGQILHFAVGEQRQTARCGAIRWRPERAAISST